MDGSTPLSREALGLTDSFWSLFVLLQSTLDEADQAKWQRDFLQAWFPHGNYNTLHFAFLRWLIVDCNLIPSDKRYQVDTILDSLIAARNQPATVKVFVANSNNDPVLKHIADFIARKDNVGLSYVASVVAMVEWKYPSQEGKPKIGECVLLWNRLRRKVLALMQESGATATIYQFKDYRKPDKIRTKAEIARTSPALGGDQA